MKKTIYFVTFLFLGLCLFTGCQDKPLVNGQLEALYKSIPDKAVGFSSIEYSLTNYEGNKQITLLAGQGLTFVSNVSEQDSIFFTLHRGRGVEISSLGTTVRVCYKNKPFYQASNQSYSGNKAPIKFSLREETIDENSFVFIYGQYDFQGEIGGLYVNGNIISRSIMVRGGVPFLPYSVKKIGEKIIINFESANYASLYALFNEKTGQLTLPTDYETIENDWTTASKKLN
jgi:hypothetical protein